LVETGWKHSQRKEDRLEEKLSQHSCVHGRFQPGSASIKGLCNESIGSNSGHYFLDWFGPADPWQLHYATESGADRSLATDFIVNVRDKYEGKRINVVAAPMARSW
jgi:hypothetical protein